MTMAAFRRTLGISVRLCAPNDPEAKGLVERTNGYFETSFLPGRRFEGVADFNRQLTSWLRRANNRVYGTTRVRPAEAIFEDRGAMLAFPPVLPDPSWRLSTRLPRDHYVRVDTNDYSVKPRYAGRRVGVRVTLDEVIAVEAERLLDAGAVGRERDVNDRSVLKREEERAAQGRDVEVRRLRGRNERAVGLGLEDRRAVGRLVPEQRELHLVGSVVAEVERVVALQLDATAADPAGDHGWPELGLDGPVVGHLGEPEVAAEARGGAVGC